MVLLRLAVAFPDVNDDLVGPVEESVIDAVKQGNEDGTLVEGLPAAPLLPLGIILDDTDEEFVSEPENPTLETVAKKADG